MSTYKGKSKRQNKAYKTFKKENNFGAKEVFNSRLGVLQKKADNSPTVKELESTQKNANHKNNTGIPDDLKLGMENLTGISLNDVRVHRNSNEPSNFSALAYAKGSNIHLGPGQEKHLPHELGHIVQQKQGRVKPTMQVNENIKINDDNNLEKDADNLGDKALQTSINENSQNLSEGSKKNNVIQRLGDEDMLRQQMAIRRRAISGEDNETDDNPYLIRDTESGQNTPGKLADRQTPEGGMGMSQLSQTLGEQLTKSKTEAQIKKRDQFDEFAFKQSKYADTSKPGKKNTRWNRFMNFGKSIGRGIGNLKEMAKGSWLARKFGFSGLNKNERDAANARDKDISRGQRVVDSYNKEGGKWAKKADKASIGTSVGAFLAGKSPVGGKIAKNAVKSAGAFKESEYQSNVASAYNEDKGDAIVNIGSQAKGESFATKSEQTKMKGQKFAAKAAGAAVDEINPFDKVNHALQELTGDTLSLPSAESAAGAAYDFANRKKTKELSERQSGESANQARAFSVQNTGYINQKGFDEHQQKNAGLMSELKSKFSGDGKPNLKSVDTSESSKGKTGMYGSELDFLTKNPKAKAMIEAAQKKGPAEVNGDDEDDWD